VYLIDDEIDDPATQQRLYRLIITRSRSSDGEVYQDPEDVHHPEWGAGIPAHVDDPTDEYTQNEITTKILRALADDPGVSNDSPATVDYRVVGNTVYVVITYTNLNGDPVTLPPINLNPQQQ
jgi:hypothetical protein